MLEWWRQKPSEAVLLLLLRHMWLDLDFIRIETQDNRHSYYDLSLMSTYLKVPWFDRLRPRDDQHW